MFINILLFFLDNAEKIFIILLISVLLYSWVSMFINKDYKIILNCNKKYTDLSDLDFEKIKNEIKCMEGRQFEIFCEWLFKNTGEYKSVILTKATNDEGRDLILTDKNHETIFVECKRYTERATTTEEFMIGREICQKLVGAMISEGVKRGIIITTGNIHKNAWDYITKLENNTDIKIDVVNINDIIRMIQDINKPEVLTVIGIC